MAELFLWVVIVLLIVQIGLLGLLIAWKQRSLVREKKNVLVLNNYRPVVNAYVTGESERFPELPKKQVTPAIVELLLDEYSGNQHLQTTQGRLAALADGYLTDHYRKVLKKGHWAERLNALYFIEDFQIHALKDDCYRHFRTLSKQDEEYRQTLRTCATLQEERLIEEQLEKSDISSGLIKELLFRLDEKLLAKVLADIQHNEDLSETALRAFLMFSGEHRVEMAFPFVEQKLADERKEIRLKAMHSLSLYGQVSDVELVRPFFESEYWEERMYAAKLTGACRLAEFTDHLLATMADANWWVRFSSAESLNACTGGEALLEDAAAGHHDPYARDIARHVLTRKGRNAS